MFSQDNSLSDATNLKAIENFESLLRKTESLAKSNKSLFFKDKSLLLEQTRNLQLKCKHLKEDESKNFKKRSKSAISKIPNENNELDSNLSFCQKSHRTDLLEESKYSDPSHLAMAKNPLKYSSVSSILHNNDNDLSTTIPHSAFDKASDVSKTFKVQSNEASERKVEFLEEKIKELRFELGKKESEIRALKNGLFSSNIDLNDVFETAKEKKVGIKKLFNELKMTKKSYEAKIKNLERKNKSLEEIYKQQNDEMERMGIFVEEILDNLRRNEKEFEIVKRNNQILLENISECEKFKVTILNAFDNFKGSMQEKLLFYASKLKKLNENERIIERVTAENQELKAQKSFLMQKVRLV